MAGGVEAAGVRSEVAALFSERIKKIFDAEGDGLSPVVTVARGVAGGAKPTDTTYDLFRALMLQFASGSDVYEKLAQEAAKAEPPVTPVVTELSVTAQEQLDALKARTMLTAGSDAAIVDAALTHYQPLTKVMVTSPVVAGGAKISSSGLLQRAKLCVEIVSTLSVGDRVTPEKLAHMYRLVVNLPAEDPDGSTSENLIKSIIKGIRADEAIRQAGLISAAETLRAEYEVSSSGRLSTGDISALVKAATERLEQQSRGCVAIDLTAEAAAIPQHIEARTIENARRASQAKIDMLLAQQAAQVAAGSASGVSPGSGRAGQTEAVAALMGGNSVSFALGNAYLAAVPGLGHQVTYSIDATGKRIQFRSRTMEDAAAPTSGLVATTSVPQRYEPAYLENGFLVVSKKTLEAAGKDAALKAQIVEAAEKAVLLQSPIIYGKDSGGNLTPVSGTIKLGRVDPELREVMTEAVVNLLLRHPGLQIDGLTKEMHDRVQSAWDALPAGHVPVRRQPIFTSACLASLGESIRPDPVSSSSTPFAALSSREQRQGAVADDECSRVVAV